MLPFLLVTVWVAVAVTATLQGLDYYALSLEERAFSALAPVYSPTGTVGHGYGVVGTAMLVVGVAGYSARKRIPLLSRSGALRHWLQVHIFLCTLGPFLVLLHTTFKFGGLVSVAFWSMTVVVASGIFGRYVYSHLPKTVNGALLGLEDVRRRTAELADLLRRHTGLHEALLEGVAPDLERGGGPPSAPTDPGRLLPAVMTAVREDFRARSRSRAVSRLLRREGVSRSLRTEIVSLVRERDRLRRQALVLRPFQRLFRYWHIVHLPLAIVMFLILAVHVATAVLLGYTWVL